MGGRAMSDKLRTAPDVRFTHSGIGMSTHWLCFGCKKNRPQLGSKGRGIFKRCGVCLTAAAKAAQQVAA
jgi:hypothetical protein